MRDNTPKAVAAKTIEVAEAKAASRLGSLLALAFLGGAYIAFGAFAATMGAHDLTSYGAARVVSGTLFSCGLMLVLIAGGELFTGNVLIWMAVLERRVGIAALVTNLVWVFLANAAGALVIAYLADLSGLFATNHGLVGAYAAKVAYGKLSLGFGEALVRGILCNWLVCLGVWMAYAAKDVVGKVWAIFFPITLFVTANFEHSIANLYYIPAGILAAADPATLAAAQLSDKADVFTLANLFRNLVPVTIGNIIGGALFVGTLYWLAYIRPERAGVTPQAKNRLARPTGWIAAYRHGQRQEHS
jgi:formate/nitrite transporter